MLYTVTEDSVYADSQGRMMGCLPRVSLPGERFPLFRDAFPIIPPEQWEEVDMEHLFWHVFDQNGVGSCFPAGTLVRMKDGSEKAINEVRLLEEVVTAEGRTGRVTKTMVREFSGLICRLEVAGSGHVRCTPEHPVLTKRGYVLAEDLREGDMVAFPRYAPLSTAVIQTSEHCSEARYTGSQRVVQGKAGSTTIRKIPGKAAAVLTTHPLPDMIHLTAGFGRLIGLFLAEGCTSYGKLTYTFGLHEEATLASEVVQLFASELGVDARLQVRGNGSVKVNVYGVHWARLFESLCSKLATGKRPHPDVTSGPREFLEGVLSGWCDGDGNGPGKNGGISVSHGLAMAMFDIANFLGKQPTVRTRVPPLSAGVKSRQPIWVVSWGEGRDDYRRHQDETHMWRQVRSVEREEFSGPVFNLEVEGDHSYVAEGVGVHNCTCNAACGAVMGLREVQGLPRKILSPGNLYGRINGGVDRGSALDDALEELTVNGVCTAEIQAPNDWRVLSPNWKQSGRHYKILEWFDLEGDSKALFTAMQMRLPTVIGVMWPGGGGHAILSMGCRKDARGSWEAKILNSWKKTWGNNGFGYLTQATLRTMPQFGCWAGRVATSSQGD